MLSKTSQYAINAVIALASASQSGDRMGVAELAEEVKAPQHFLAKVLQQLVRSGLVSSVKGPGGGFFMTPENMEHHLADVVILFDGEEFFNSCILGMPECSSQNPCPLHAQFAAYREGLSFHLKSNTIDSLVRYLDMQKE
jgi:Rrf2 family protein